MFSFKVTWSIPLTSFLFVIMMNIGNVNAQVTDSAFAPCVMMSGGYTVDVVMLGTDQDCNSGFVEQAVKYYKAQGYIERQYSNVLDEQLMSLQR